MEFAENELCDVYHYRDMRFRTYFLSLRAKKMDSNRAENSL